jgi:hypothetical protein
VAHLEQELSDKTETIKKNEMGQNALVYERNQKEGRVSDLVDRVE